MDSALAQLLGQLGFAGALLWVVFKLGDKLGGRALDLAEARMKQDAEDARANRDVLAEGLRLSAAGQERIAERLADHVTELRVDVAKLQGVAEGRDWEQTDTHDLPTARVVTPGTGVRAGYYSHRPGTKGDR